MLLFSTFITFTLLLTIIFKLVTYFLLKFSSKNMLVKFMVLLNLFWRVIKFYLLNHNLVEGLIEIIPLVLLSKDVKCFN